MPCPCFYIELKLIIYSFVAFHYLLLIFLLLLNKKIKCPVLLYFLYKITIAKTFLAELIEAGSDYFVWNDSVASISI